MSLSRDELQEYAQEARTLRTEVDAIRLRAETEGRELRLDENNAINIKSGRILRLESALNEVKAARNAPGTLRHAIGGDFTKLVSGGVPAPDQCVGPNPLTRTSDYAEAFRAWVSSKGTVVSESLHAGADGAGGFLLPGSERLARVPSIPGMSAALDEGTPGSGGYAVPSVVIPQVVPLGMPDLGILNESTVIATVSDQKWPIQASFGQAAGKAESGATTNAFQEIDPTIGQFTLSAFQAGGYRTLSWELIQDVPQFQSFATDDLVRSQLIYEGALYVNGTGTGQAQGLIGNVGTGTGTAYQLTGATTDGMTLIDSLFDVVGTLKAAYQPNAVFVMSRATLSSIRRAQAQANLYIPVVTQDADGTPRVLGYRVAFDANMPSLPTATSTGVVPILFGSFKDGYLIGIRGGAGINIKVLDQPLAIQGQTVLLAYRRIDGRVRRSEAIQEITISHS